LTKRGNWGRWGPEDELGALNLLTPQVVREAVRAARKGRVYQLGVPIQSEGVPLLAHRGKPMRLTLQDPTDEELYRAFGCEPGTGANEDVLVLASHTTSHMDALVHVYEDFHHYNGVPSSAMGAMAGATKHGIEKAGGFVARAVLLDMPRHIGGGPWLEPGHRISRLEIEEALQAQGAEIRSGDVVLVRTGYLQMWFDHPSERRFVQPGITVEAAAWLAEQDIVAVGSDNAAVEVIPFDGGDFLAVHKLLLVHHGIYLLEYLDLSAPASDECWEALIAVAPLKVTGATGSPINPILVG